MRPILFLLFIIGSSITAISQDDRRPTQKEILAQQQQAIAEAKLEREETKKQLAAAKASGDPEAVKQFEGQLVSLEQMIAMLEKTNLTGNSRPKTLPASDKKERAYVSPFKPIKLSQPAKAPKQEQATDQLLWYRGRRIDPNTLITPSGLIARYNRQERILTVQPNKEPDTIYYGLINTLGLTKQFKSDYSKRRESVMNSFFMYPQIKEAYDEFDVMSNRYYELAKNTVRLPYVPLNSLGQMISDLNAYVNRLPAIKLISPPKRPNDLCLCEVPEVRANYETELKSWIHMFFEEEIKIADQVYEIATYTDYLRSLNQIVSQTINEYDFLGKALERAISKLKMLLEKYESADIDNVLLEDGLVYAKTWLEKWISMDDLERIPAFSTPVGQVKNLFAAIRDNVFSDRFETYIEIQKNNQNFNAVFDYGLYLSHEYNKRVLSPNYNVNDNFDAWVNELKDFNRFTLRIKIDFIYHLVYKNPDKIRMISDGTMESANITVSLARHDCNWELYIPDINYSNRQSSGEEFKIPLNVTNGKRILLPEGNEKIYTGPPTMALVFPNFNINFCGQESTVLMQSLSYAPNDLKRHATDQIEKVYTIHMLDFANAMFIGAKRTQLNVNQLISTAAEMMSMNQAPMSSTSTGDPAMDHLMVEFKMNRKKYELQYSLSQTTHKAKTKIKLEKDPGSPPDMMFNKMAELADPNDEDGKIGRVLVHGGVTISLKHTPL